MKRRSAPFAGSLGADTGTVPVLRGTAHFCGGCGAAFVVADFLAVLPVDLSGTAREFCACCLDFLGNRIPSSESTCVSGYDEEGQALNGRFPALTPTEKRAHRAPETQRFLADVLRANAARLGVERPEQEGQPVAGLASNCRASGPR